MEKGKLPNVYFETLKSGDISYYGQIWDKEKKRPKFIRFGRKSQGWNEEKVFVDLSKMKSGETPIEKIKIKKKNVSSELTLDELAQQHFEEKYIAKEQEYRKDFNEKSTPLETLKENPTFNAKIQATRNDFNRYKRHISPYLGHLTLSRINSDRDYITNFMIDLTDKLLSDKTNFLIISVGKTIVNTAIRRKKIPFQENPFENIDGIKNPHNYLQRVLTEKEMGDLLFELSKNNHRGAYLFAVILVNTGCRVRTALNIQKKHIDFDKDILYLTNFKVKNRQYKIALTDTLKQILWDETVLMGDEDYIIQPLRKGYYRGQPISDTPVAFTKVCDRLFNKGIDKSNARERLNQVVSAHTIRHSVGTNMAARKVSLLKITSLLDHSSVTQSEKYIKMAAEMESEEMNDYSSTIFDEMEKRWEGLSDG